MPMILTGQWKRTISTLTKWAARSPMAVDAAVRGEAYAFQGEVIKAFRKGGADTPWKKLSPITLALRRGASKMGGPASKGTKPLIRTGDMRRSVNVKKQGYAHYTAGVHRTAPAARGLTSKKKPYVNIAELHETGMVVIPITDKMRRFFRVLFWKGILPYPWPSKNKQYILIHRRSFIGDTAKKFAKNHPARMMLRYTNHLKGIKSKVPI